MTAFVSGPAAEAGSWLETFEFAWARHTEVAAAITNNSPAYLLFIALISSTDADEGRFQFYSSGV
ncbi:MAG: hypothetical protein WBQ85_20270 [Candidatus Sulfotelmatobacter sp.]